MAKCFLISPIGEADSLIRQHANNVRDHLIKKAIGSDYDVIRADDLNEAGTITVQVVRELAEADLAVADLTGTNPNVMYELAVRHSFNKPVILICKKAQELPFDIAAERTVFFDFSDFRSIDVARDQIACQAEQIRESGANDASNPVQNARLSAGGFASHLPVDKMVGGIAEEMTTVRGHIDHMMSRLMPAIDKLENERVGSSDKAKTCFVAFGEVIFGVPFVSSQSIQSFMNEVWYASQEKGLDIEPYTYMFDWVLVSDDEGEHPLIAKGSITRMRIGNLFSDGSVLRVVKLDKPLFDPDVADLIGVRNHAALPGRVPM